MSNELSAGFSEWIVSEFNDAGVDGEALGSYVVSLIESSTEGDPLAEASEFLQSSVVCILFVFPFSTRSRLQSLTPASPLGKRRRATSTTCCRGSETS